MGIMSDLKENDCEHSGMHCADGTYDSCLHMPLLQRVGLGNNFSESLQARAWMNIYEVLIIV